MTSLLGAGLLAAAASATLAEELVEAPPPPPMPEEATTQPPGAPANGDQGLEPQVTIIKREGSIIEEYRTNGQLYMVKITPEKGVPYYLIDTDGDGSLETRSNDLEPPEIVQWRIFSW